MTGVRGWLSTVTLPLAMTVDIILQGLAYIIRC